MIPPIQIAIHIKSIALSPLWFNSLFVMFFIEIWFLYVFKSKRKRVKTLTN